MVHTSTTVCAEKERAVQNSSSFQLRGNIASHQREKCDQLNSIYDMDKGNSLEGMLLSV